jgi:hypothetical protein
MTQANHDSISSQNQPGGHVWNTVAFLRMATVQMRRLAECAPEIAVELRDLAGDIEEEANYFGRDETV